MLDLSSALANTPIEPHATRGGLCVQFAANGASVSPVWNLGGFEIQFVRLPAGESTRTEVARPTYLKVLTGEIDCPPYRAFPAVGAVTSAQITEPQIQAVRDCVLCLVRESDQAPEQITDMMQLRCTGPLDERLQWQTFDEKFRAVTDAFSGLDAHMVPGFHLLDDAGAEIAYVHFWTTGKGVDVSTHNHGQAPSDLAPAFAEVHLVLRNGTGQGGMYRCDAPGADSRERIPMQAGEEHGPFFHFDATSGAPVLRDNGAVSYPWHGWQGGSDADPAPAYDLVAAFEISPQYARVG